MEKKKFSLDNFKKTMGAVLFAVPLLAGTMAFSTQAHADSTTNRAALVGVGTAAVTGAMTGDWKAALGALGGAAAGSVVGQGNGRVAATALGAIAGGYMTQKASQERVSQQNNYPVYTTDGYGYQQQPYYGNQRYNQPRTECVPGYPNSDCSNNGYQQPNYNNQGYGYQQPQYRQQANTSTRVIRDPETGELVTVTVQRTGQYEANYGESIDSQVRRKFR